MTEKNFLFPISYFLLKGACARNPHSQLDFGELASSELSVEDSRAAIGNRQWAIRDRQSAFSFIEVLFAVILLGIGFIMIAGIFPVAIQQTAAVSNETQGNAVIRDAIKKIQALADAPSGFPPAAPGASNSLFQSTLVGTPPNTTPTVQAFSPNVMQALGSDSFFTVDRQFGWVGFYRRDSATSPFAQVFIVALQNPNFPNYVTKYQPGETTAINPAPPIFPPVAPPIPPMLYNYSGSLPAVYSPTPLPGPPANGTPVSPGINLATFTYDPNNKTTTVKLTKAASAVTGAFVIVAAQGPGAPAVPNSFIGRIFRLGTVPPNTPVTSIFSPNGQTFFLQLGWDLTDADALQLTGNKFNAYVWIIGAAPTVGANGEFTGPFTGPNQDIAAGSALIRVNTSNN